MGSFSGSKASQSASQAKPPALPGDHYCRAWNREGQPSSRWSGTLADLLCNAEVGDGPADHSAIPAPKAGIIERRRRRFLQRDPVRDIALDSHFIRSTVLAGILLCLPAWWIVRSQEELQVGYAVIETEEESPPVSSALFSFRNQDGVLVSEAGVAAVTPISRGHLFVEQQIPTGVALANPGNESQMVSFRLQSLNSVVIGVTSRVLPAGGHLAIFADQLFPNSLPPNFRRALEIDSVDPSVPVTLKLTINERGDPILTTLPVADLEHPESGSLRVIPPVGFGLGFTTRLIFLGTGQAETLSGRIFFRRSSSEELITTLAGLMGSEFEFHIQGNGASRLSGDSLVEIADIILDPSNPLGSEIVVNAENQIDFSPIVIAPETIVVLAGKALSNVTLEDTQTIVFRTPRLSPGLKTLTVQNRGGLDQAPFGVPPRLALTLREISISQISSTAESGWRHHYDRRRSLPARRPRSCREPWRSRPK